MFTECYIQTDEDLDNMVKSLLKDRDFAELHDNFVGIGIFLFNNGKVAEIPGRIQVATELEKRMGYDVIIYMNAYWVMYNNPTDVEAYIYQMLLSITPLVVGKENSPIIKLNKEKGITVSPETVARYGKGVKWYRDLYK